MSFVSGNDLKSSVSGNDLLVSIDDNVSLINNVISSNYLDLCRDVVYNSEYRYHLVYSPTDSSNNYYIYCFNSFSGNINMMDGELTHIYQHRSGTSYVWKIDISKFNSQNLDLSNNLVYTNTMSGYPSLSYERDNVVNISMIKEFSIPIFVIITIIVLFIKFGGRK